MSDHPRAPYQTPPSSPPRSPLRRYSDRSPLGGGSSKSSQMDPRGHRVSSSSGTKVLPTKKGDPPKGPSRSRSALDPPPRRETLDVPPLHSMAPPSVSLQSSLPPPPTVSFKGKYSKSTTLKSDPPKNLPSKRKASELSPTPDSADEGEAAPVIRNVSVGRKKVTFKHIDLEMFQEKHEFQAFEVSKKKKIGPKQSSTVMTGEAEAYEEVTSPVNEGFAEDEEMSDGEERTDISPPDDEGGGTGEEGSAPVGGNTGGVGGEGFAAGGNEVVEGATGQQAENAGDQA
ncbi:proline-rich receptor-like protein kinase PERK2 [Papaver somniferum]|uniref:proline-rich receptor-like protein kinase PERK2 n=1 Tax=Papaver somniferum TaxID=3469 RepID=UPI000E6F93F7|nr:proline-rich receptor-like protein kinase PERK2 [Papaver somniferum]